MFDFNCYHDCLSWAGGLLETQSPAIFLYYCLKCTTVVRVIHYRSSFCISSFCDHDQKQEKKKPNSYLFLCPLLRCRKLSKKLLKNITFLLGDTSHTQVENYPCWGRSVKLAWTTKTILDIAYNCTANSMIICLLHHSTPSFAMLSRLRSGSCFLNVSIGTELLNSVL